MAYTTYGRRRALFAEHMHAAGTPADQSIVVVADWVASHWLRIIRRAVRSTATRIRPAFKWLKRGARGAGGRYADVRPAHLTLLASDGRTPPARWQLTLKSRFHPTQRTQRTQRKGRMGIDLDRKVGDKIGKLSVRKT